MRNGKTENLKVVVGDLAQIFPERFGGAADKEPGKTEAAPP